MWNDERSKITMNPCCPEGYNKGLCIFFYKRHSGHGTAVNAELGVSLKLANMRERFELLKINEEARGNCGEGEESSIRGYESLFRL